MNIFVLDTDPVLAAQYHCDKHVGNMIKESAQMLATVTGVGYEPTHSNHPCTLWVGKEIKNALWLISLARALNDEYMYRYNKIVPHKSWTIIEDVIRPVVIRNLLSTDQPLINMLPDGEYDFPQCMPDEYKHEDTVQAYRNYYKGDKVRFATWKNREAPYWWSN